MVSEVLHWTEFRPTDKACTVKTAKESPISKLTATLSPPVRPANSSIRFILNGLAHANEIFGEDVFQLEDWRVIGEYVYDVDGGRHQACVSPIRETVAMGTVIQADERVQIEQSLKYSKIGRDKLWRGAGFRELASWSRGSEYGTYGNFL